MKSNKFNYKNFFGNTGIFEKLFERYEYPWEVLLDIESFIDSFESKFQDLGYKKLRERVFVGKNATIDPTAKIEGPAIIGSGTTLRCGAYLRENCLLGENVIIGHSVELKQLIVLSDSSISHLNYVGNSIIGKNVKIAGGAILANTRLDMQEVTIKDEENTIGTGVNKFSCIIGDESFVGANSVINPGTILAKKSLVFPLVSVSGTHLEGKKHK